MKRQNLLTHHEPNRTRAYTFHSEFQLILAHNFVYLHGDCGIRVAVDGRSRWSRHIGEFAVADISLNLQLFSK